MRPWVARLLGVFALTIMVTAGLIQVLAGRGDADGAVAALIAFGSFGIVGVVIASKQPSNAIGWIFLALEAFSRRLRDEVDLDVLTTDLVTMVGETLQPRHARLWLRAAASSEGRSGA